jgi:hypothetical protein
MNTKRRRNQFDHKPHQEGLASIVVVFVIIIVLSLMSLGLARFVDRATRQSAADTLGAAADFAALAGVNQAMAYIKGEVAKGKTASSPQCDTLTRSGAPLENLTDLSGNGRVKYTCVLISSLVDDLLYKKLPAYRSQVVKLVTQPPSVMGKLMVSWQSYDPSLDNSPASGTTLFDETTWGQNEYQPMLRLSLYPVSDGNMAFIASNAKTYYLYPNALAGSNIQALIPGSGVTQTAVPYTQTDGSTIRVDCNKADTTATVNPAVFKGSGEFKCNLIVDSFPVGTTYMYARITPLYGDADVKFQGNDASANSLQFSGVQYLVDITAKANNAVKRLQARVDPSGEQTSINPFDNAFPEYALRSANTVCKRLVVNSGTPVTDAGSAANCNVDYGTAGNAKLTVLISTKGSGDIGDSVADTAGGSGGTGHIICPGKCSFTYATGQTVMLKARHGSGSYFVGWRNAPGCGSGDTCLVTMDATKSVTAEFHEN